MFDLLASLQLIFSITAFYCGITIWLRSPSYLPNRLLGSGYFIYGFPGALLCISHIITTVEIIRLSVQVMVVGSAFGIGLIYLGTLTYFKGSLSLHRKTYISVLAISFAISLLVILFPNSIAILTLDPVNSELHPLIGLMIFLWHNILCFASIRHLGLIRKSILELGDGEGIRNINFLLAGFYISICALFVYLIGNFGETSLTDDIFFTLNVANLLCIWWGLRFQEKNREIPIALTT